MIFFETKISSYNLILSTSQNLKSPLLITKLLLSGS